MGERSQKKRMFLKAIRLTLAVMAALVLAPIIKGEPEAQWISLDISPAAISFPAADPDVQPVIQANSQVNLWINLPKSRRWNLYVMAQGNLISAEGGIIPIANVSWVAAPKPPLQDGVLIAGQNILMGSGRGRLNNGVLTFYFKNSWDYLAGTYTQIITFTVSQI